MVSEEIKELKKQKKNIFQKHGSKKAFKRINRGHLNLRLPFL